MSAKPKSNTSSPKPRTTTPKQTAGVNQKSNASSPNPLRSEIGTSRNTSRSPKSRNSNKSPNAKRSPSPNKAKAKKETAPIPDTEAEDAHKSVHDDETVEENKIPEAVVEEQPEAEEPLVRAHFLFLYCLKSPFLVYIVIRLMY